MQIECQHPRRSGTSIQKRRHTHHGCKSCPHWVLLGSGIPAGAPLPQGFSTPSPRSSHFGHLEGRLYSSTFAPDLTNFHVFYAVILPAYVTAGRKATRGQWGAGLEHVHRGFPDWCVVNSAKWEQGCAQQRVWSKLKCGLVICFTFGNYTVPYF